VDARNSHCSYKDDTLACWNSTLEFFERVLLAQMRHYIAVQINIDQWHRRHTKPYAPDYEKMKAAAEQSFEAHLLDDPQDEVLNATTVKAVVDALIDRVAQNNRLINWIPHYSCPMPCEHKYSVWRNLFIVSTLLNVCLIIAVVPFVRRMSKSDASEALIGRG
jgi:hypothetical protein